MPAQHFIEKKQIHDLMNRGHVKMYSVSTQSPLEWELRKGLGREKVAADFWSKVYNNRGSTGASCSASEVVHLFRSQD